MKVLFIFALLLATSFASSAPLFAWQGTIDTYFTAWNPPIIAYDNTCTNYSSYDDYYVHVNFTVPTTGVYAIFAQHGYNMDVDVYLYNTSFSAATPCTNAMVELPSGDGVMSHSNGFYTLLAGTTYFLAISNGYKSDYAVQVYASNQTASTTATPTWQPIYTSSDGSSCSKDSDPAPYATYTWTQSGNGFIDITGYFAPTQDFTSSYLYIAIFSGTVNPTTLATDGCNAGTLLNAKYISASYLAPKLYRVPVADSTSYTVIFSGDDTDNIGAYGILVTPSIVQTLTQTGFARPGSDTPPCTTSSSSSTYQWSAVVFTAQYANYLIYNQDSTTAGNYSGFDAYTFFYQGDNSAGTACPLVGSFIAAGDYFGRAFNTTIGQTYTVIVSTYQDSTYTSNYANPVIIAGGVNPVGTVGTSTTAAAAATTSTAAAAATTTTGAAAAGTTSTTAANPAGNGATTTTSTTQANNGAVSTTHSGAAALAAPLLFLTLSLLAMF